MRVWSGNHTNVKIQKREDEKNSSTRSSGRIKSTPVRCRYDALTIKKQRWLYQLRTAKDCLEGKRKVAGNVKNYDNS